MAGVVAAKVRVARGPGRPPDGGRSAYNPRMAADRVLLTADASRRQQVLDLLSESLAAEADLQYAYLFGSFVEPGPFHDVDVAVRYGRLTPDEADRRAFELQGRIETLVGLPVDVVALNGRPVSFRFHVFRGRALVVRDDEALTDELERTARDYFDQERRLREATVEAFAQ
jgi:predicted nucleotidyltransferase